MAYSRLVDVVSQGNSGGTTSSAVNTTGATLLILLAVYFSASAAPTISDSKGNTWVPLTAQVTTGQSQLFYCANPTVGTGHTFSALGSTSFAAVSVAAYSGANAAPFDQQNGATGSANSLATGSVTPSADNELVIAGWGLALAGEPSSSSVNGGFTGINTAPNVSGNSFGIYLAELIQTTATAANPVLSYGNSSTVSGVIATFKVAAATGITFDAASNSGTQTAQSTYTFARTITGSNIFLGVDVSLLSAGSTVTSIIDNYDVTPVNLVKIGSQSTVTSLGSVESWGLAGAITGTKNIQVNLSGSVTSVATATSYTGVHQTSPTEAYSSAQATNVGAADATVNITTIADNDWVHGAIVVNDDGITANQTSRNNVSFTAVGSGANEDNNTAKTPAGAVTMSYTGVAALKTWAIGGYAIRPTTASSLNVFRLRTLLGVGK